MSTSLFTKAHYTEIMDAFGYNPIEFEPITFSLGRLSKDELQREWLCHMNGGRFSQDQKEGKRVIATTGFGLSGIPHMGTLAQILRAIRLQRAGIPVQIVLGDLDAYNGRNTPLVQTRELAAKYRKFIINLGFEDTPPSRLRAQYDSLSTLRQAYLIGRYMEDTMFEQASEDLHSFYAESGKVDPHMSYRRKLSLNLMIADFFELLIGDGFDSILVFLGIDEHNYILFGNKVIANITRENPEIIAGKQFAALYSGIIKGFRGHEKMSKSFPESGITVDMSGTEIEQAIKNGETVTNHPETNVVYQLIASASKYSGKQITEAYNECARNSKRWQEIKGEYASHLSELCLLWGNP